MNFNLIAYIIYGVLTIFTIVKVGGYIHRNGRYYVMRIFENEEIGDYLNNALLVAYYLFNIGYALMAIRNWVKIDSTMELLEVLGGKIGLIYLLLGGLHFFNIFALKIYADYQKINLFHYKTTKNGRSN